MFVSNPDMSVVVAIETADHEFPTMEAAHEFLHSMGYAQTGETEFSSDATSASIAITEFERDRVGMEYDLDPSAQLSVCFSRRVLGPTVIIEDSGQLAWDF